MKKNRFSAIAVLVALSVYPVPHAAAQSRMTFVPALSTAVVYDDNLFATHQGDAVVATAADGTPLVLPRHSSGQMLQVRPSFEGNYESPRLTFLSLYSWDMLRSNHRDLNTLDARRHAYVDTKYRSTQATTLGIAARYDRSETPGELNLDTGILSDRRVAERWQIAPNLARRLGPRVVMTAGYDWTTENEIDTPSGTLHQARVAVSREWTTRTSIVGSYLGRHFIDPSDSSTSHALLGGVTREVAPGTRFSAYAGPRVTSYRSGIKPEVSTSFARVTNRIDLALDYWHGETIILGIPGPVAVDSGTARVTWPFTRHIELGTYAGVTDILTVDSRQARVYRGTLLSSWTPRGSMYTLAASYGLDYQQGDIRRRVDGDVLRHVFRVSVTVAPRLVRSILPPDESARVKGVVR